MLCCTQEAMCNAVLEAFIKYLIDEKEVDLIAIYVATLPCSRQIELYAQLLKGTEAIAACEIYCWQTVALLISL